MDPTLKEIIGDIGTMMAIIVSVGSLLYTIKNARVTRGTSAIKATEDALKVAHEASREVQEMKNQMKLMEVQIEFLEKQLRNANKQIETVTAQLEEEIKEKESIKEWAERLVHQVRSLGGDPVPFKPSSKRSRNV